MDGRGQEARSLYEVPLAAWLHAIDLGKLYTLQQQRQSRQRGSGRAVLSGAYFAQEVEPGRQLPVSHHSLAASPGARDSSSSSTRAHKS